MQMIQVRLVRTRRPCPELTRISRGVDLNPDPLNLPQLDPRDAFLLADPSSSTGAYPVNGGSHGSSAPPLANVPWLRKTEYISRESSQRGGGMQEP